MKRVLPRAPVLDHHSPMRLLVIEDSAADGELLLALLAEALPNADVQVATSLDGALARMSRSHFDVTLADLSLPDADGLAVVSAVRAAHPDTALLVLTGRTDQELALWALAEGAQDYLVKGGHEGAGLVTALLHALQRKRAEQVAHRDLQLARGLFDALDAPTCAVGADGEIVAVNEAWRVFATSNDDRPDVGGVGTSHLLAGDRVTPSAADSRTAAAVADGLRSVLAGVLDHDEHEYPCQLPDGNRWFSVRISPVQIDRERGAVISHVDVTEMHNVQQELAHQALHDALTGLPNRLLLTDRLSQALSEASRLGGSLVGVGFLDLDKFKRINDSLGHPAGDALLVQVADRLGRQLRSGDTLSRFSGDEFVVVWRDVGHGDDVMELARRLTDALVDPFDLDSTSVNVSASVGVVVGQRSQSVGHLLAAADAAMYDAKSRGRGQVRAFTDELGWGAAELMATEVGLRAALTRSELVLHYQPVIDLASGRPVAVEALVRWQHPERGLLGPNHFIRVAESTGLIVPLGRWVLERACGDAVAFSGAASGLDVAVNLSVRQLIEPDALSHVRDALEHSGLDPRRLILEVTESAVIQDEDAAGVALDGLSALGVRIAIDDFGTGYSSLLYLRRYPINALKLDRAFVSGIGVSPDDEAICGSVLSLAHAVGATSIAEGVETPAQHAALRGFGCQQAQGFLWSPAVPVERLAAVLLACREVPIPARSRRKTSAAAPLEPAVAVRIAALHRSGASLHTIAAALNRSAVPNPAGVRWTATAIARHIAA